MSIFGNPVMLGGSGGGDDIPLLSRATWDALSTAQKKAYGLVAVQDSSSGFDRGELFYGADYTAFNLLMEACQRNYGSGPTTYTADHAGRVIAINISIHANTSSTACTSTITTTGTVVATDTQTSTSSSSGSATAGELTFSVIDLSVGDTITFSNNTVSDTSQIHLVIEADISSLTNTYWDIWPDKKNGNTVTKSLDSTKQYFIMVLQISENTRGQTISANVTPADLSITYAGSAIAYYAYMAAMVANAGSVTISTSNVENYISSAYAVYEVTT